MRFATPILMLSVILVASATLAEEPTGKLWVDDWTAFVNQNGSQRWLRAESQRSCLSENEADAEARKAAAKELLPLVKSQLSTRNINDAVALQQIEKILQQGTAVSQKHVKLFERPYGKIWQAWVLIDGSEKTVKKLSAEVDSACRAVAKQRQWHARLSTGLIGGLAIGVCALYLAANAVTRGYYTWRLRGLATLAMIGGSAAISHLV